VHRDVKGDNIRVTAEGQAKLLDWGSGWFAGARPLTDTTAPPGTTAYRPPEQRFFTWRFRKDLEARWQAQPTDDLYSLGVTVYRMVTGMYLPPLSEGGEEEHMREVPRPSGYCTLSLDLEALLLRLLSNERAQRGTAEALAREAAALAEAAGDAADKPILPTTSVTRTQLSALSSISNSEPTRSKRRRRPGFDASTWLSWAGASLVGGLLMAATLSLSLRQARLASTEQPVPLLVEEIEEVTQFAPDAGVAEEALSTVQDVPTTTTAAMMALARPMPSQAFPGQKKPPCEPGYEVAALGACWVVMKKEPPCGSGGYELDRLCVRAVFPAPSQPTSEEP
jgi:serine/threonine protein kinase